MSIYRNPGALCLVRTKRSTVFADDGSIAWIAAALSRAETVRSEWERSTHKGPKHGSMSDADGGRLKSMAAGGFRPRDPIARLTFRELKGVPDQLLTDSFTHDAYEKLVSKNSVNLPESLLDMSGIEERVTWDADNSIPTAAGCAKTGPTLSFVTILCGTQ